MFLQWKSPALARPMISIRFWHLLLKKWSPSYWKEADSNLFCVIRWGMCWISYCDWKLLGEKLDYSIANTFVGRMTSQLFSSFQYQAKVLLCFSYTKYSTWKCIRELGKGGSVEFLRPHKFNNDLNCRFVNDLNIRSWPLMFPVSRKQGLQ